MILYTAKGNVANFPAALLVAEEAARRAALLLAKRVYRRMGDWGETAPPVLRDHFGVAGFWKTKGQRPGKKQADERDQEQGRIVVPRPVQDQASQSRKQGGYAV